MTTEEQEVHWHPINETHVHGRLVIDQISAGTRGGWDLFVVRYHYPGTDAAAWMWVIRPEASEVTKCSGVAGSELHAKTFAEANWRLCTQL